jgi:hypothetical protein
MHIQDFDMLLNVLQYLLMFLLTEYLVMALVFFLTRNHFISLYTADFGRKRKNRKSTFKFTAVRFMAFFQYISFHSKNTLCIRVHCSGYSAITTRRYYTVLLLATHEQFTSGTPNIYGSRNSVVGKAAGYGLHDPGFDRSGDEIFWTHCDRPRGARSLYRMRALQMRCHCRILAAIKLRGMIRAVSDNLAVCIGRCHDHVSFQ